MSPYMGPKGRKFSGITEVTLSENKYNENPSKLHILIKTAHHIIASFLLKSLEAKICYFWGYFQHIISL